MSAKTLEKEIIIVLQSGKWGPKIGNEYYGINDPLTPENFVAGKSYEVLISRGKPTEKYPAGKKYIAQIINEVASIGTTNVVQKTAEAFLRASDSARATADKAVSQTGDKEAYWDKKNQDMRLGGIMHDTAAIVAALVTVHGFTQEQAMVSFDQVFTNLVELRDKRG